MKKNTGFLLFSTVICGAIFLSVLVACKQSRPTLIDTFKDMFLVGTALNRDQVMGKDSSSIKLVKEQFNSITSENDMKWEKIHPQPNVYDFTAADSFVNFGVRNKMFIIGHCLVWHYQTPRWVFEDANGNPVSRDTLLKRLHDHIFAVVGRYKGRVNGWDVVNEAVDDNGGLRKTKWLEIIGEDYIEKAFEYAHEADPSAELYYNDYSLPNKIKRDEVVNLLRNLESNGIKVDGVGMQGHYDLIFPPLESLDSSIVAFSEQGVNVMITEFDLSILPRPNFQQGADINMKVDFAKQLNPYVTSLPDSMQTVLANRYNELFKILVKHQDVITRVTFWGVNDRQSWRNNWPVPGRTDYPLLFDRNNQPKRAFDAVIKCATEKSKK